ncbi:hypothetical protein C479_03626 [Halovivax asiaticus JCM 14624]|uniref:Uncharacterized protein n=1 Tax=Halovivax asiaticus JCM 14624 TaxID=1227490 RepID=M0BW75_9EURY|nr:hypothetical protein C479_03626 [Halovivax asiaticus JCM 14624]
MAPYALPVGIVGTLVSVVLFAYTRYDADRVGVSRPLLWALATSGTLVAGVVMYLFTSAPLPGVIMTANTGTVLYGFERELTRRDDQPAEPGQLPFSPGETESADDKQTSGDAEPASGDEPAGTQFPSQRPAESTDGEDVADPR